ncbi:MAG: TetR/AcrR family transcriptional regulator [Paenisporosarcina sp.]|uniref:TetR/AcrR family transcriptional regulator n=1 Tax=Paenisporosarcina sp. TaxID=1932001 RepID=UPI003C74E094
MSKKQLIIEKSLELFAKQGFEATSIQQITEYCGISKGAFYLSFKSKDELILALIDHFMIQFTADADYVVTNTEDNEKLFYEFYYSTFNSFQKHSDFAQVLMKEQTHSFNKDFIIKMRTYDRMFEKTISSIIERVYGAEVELTKYDLVYCIKGFISIYSQLFLIQKLPMDLNLLSLSLVEKTNLLASHTTIPFISQEMMQMVMEPFDEEVTKEQILDIMEQKIEEIEEPIEKESLILLKQHLLEPTLSPAIVKGLIENIRNHPHGKSISYLLRSYYEF